jgi:hypothetical protein
MNTVKTAISTDNSSLCVKLKELLKRYNVPYEERQEGNAMVIGIKARNVAAKLPQYRTGSIS